jgi:hypothetical protein
MVMTSAGLGPENACAGKDQQQLQTTDLFSITGSVYLKKLLVVSLKVLEGKTKRLVVNRQS